MKKRKFRTLEELYGVSEEVSEPKITPVLKGGYRIQGPADEAEPVIQVSCGAEKGFGGHFSSGKLYTRAESGTCNVCDIPCSSWMHFDRVASLVGNRTDFSDEGYEEKLASRCCFNDAGFLSPCKSNASEDQRHTSSETSNLLSRCSSHDSFSENAESKVTLRVSHASEDIEMGQTVAEDGCLPNSSTFHGNVIFSNQHKNLKDLEGPGDDISCISRADGSIGDCNGVGNKKNVSCSSASVNSSPIGVAIVNVEQTSHCLVSSHCGEELEHKPEFTKESMRKTDVLSKKLDSSEISSLRGAYAGPASPKGEPSECSGDQVESSLARVATSSFGGQMPDKKENSEKSSALLETSSSAQKRPLQSQLIDDNVESDVLEYEVKVCDICGDTGREELLATCTKCNDGAEHIYCTRLKLEKVPEQDWMCEECMVKEEIQKEMKGTIEFLEGSSLDQTRKNSRNSSTSNFENCLEVESMDLIVPKSRAKSLDSAPQFSAKRPADCLETGPVMKKRTLETITRSTKVPSSQKKDILSRDSSFRNLCKEKVKQAHETFSFGDCSSNNTRENACLPTVSGHNSPKIPQQLQMPRGSLLKSNSFHILDSNLKGKLPEKDVFWKQKSTRETDTSDMKKGTGRMMNKSLSFNDVGSKHLNVSQSKVKMLSSKFSHAEDLKRLQRAKQYSLQRDHKYKSNNCHKVSAVAGSGHSGPTADKKIASHGDTVSAHHSGTTCSELKSMQFQRNTSDSSEPTSRLSPKDLKCSHGQVVSGAKWSSLCLSNVNKDPSPRMSDSSHEPKPNQSIPQVVLTRSSPLTNNRRSCNPGAILQDHSSEIGKLSNQEEKSRIICSSSSSQPRQKIPAGSRSTHCQRCKGIGHSTEYCPTMSSQVHILDARNSKEVNKNGKMGDVVKAAIVGRDDLHRRSRSPNQSNELSMSSSNANCIVSSNDSLSRSSTWLGNPFSADETNEQQIRVAKDVRRHAEDNKQAAYMIKAENSNSIIPSDEGLYVRDVPRFSQISAVPELDYIWQGGFEVCRIGRLSSHHTGIQAHLSTCASPKVHDVMHMLPPKIILEEVPRLSTWPAQFQENYATEKDIALYFFAADLESYRRNYKSLLECMIKNDLALKGNLKGVELLIFSSNLLPEKSQRWNALSYLWGVFRVRRTNDSEHVPTAHKQLPVPCLNVLPSDEDLSITTSRQSFWSLSATKIAPQELQHISAGRMTSFDQKPSLVNNISCSSAPIEGEQSSNDMLQTNISQNKNRDGEGRVEVDPKLCLQEMEEHRKAGMKLVEEKTECERAQSYFSGIHEYHTRDKKHSDDGYPSGVNEPQRCFSIEDLRRKGAQNVEIAKKSRMMAGSASGSVDCSLGLKFSQQQASSGDGEDQTKSGFPNLELSLGPEKKSEKQGMVSSYLGIVNKKYDQDKHPNPESNRKNSDEELSLSLSLCLSFPDRTNARA